METSFENRILFSHQKMYTLIEPITQKGISARPNLGCAMSIPFSRRLKKLIRLCSQSSLILIGVQYLTEYDPEEKNAFDNVQGLREDEFGCISLGQ